MKKKDSLNDKKQYPSNNQNIYKNMKNDVKSKNNINNLYSDSNANKNDIHKKFSIKIFINFSYIFY